MGDKRNYAALDWIVGEISETLNDARQSLEAFVEDPRDTARIRFCLTHIHQVHGSLQMVEFHGASLFAEEMESLAEAIMQGEVTNEKEAQEALMRSLLQLPLYLEQVKNSQDDHPSAVLPLLNDLRAVRKQSYLSETNLFTPDLSSVGQVRGDRHEVLQDSAKLKQIVQKLREMYQYAAASVLRGIKIDENLGYIEKVLTRLEGLSRGTLCHPVWQVSAALSEALVRDDVELSIAVRGLLRYIARELRILEEHCPAAFDAPPRESLLRNILYYVARADEGGPRTQQVQRQYGLESALLGGTPGGTAHKDRGLISQPEPDAIRSVVVALQDELNTCKHLLDSALSGHGSLSDIEQMMPYVKRIGDTLAVLGIGEMRKQMQTQYEALQSIAEAGTYTDIQLIDIAGALANIENRLEAIAKGAGKNIDYANVDERAVEIDSAKEAVLSECRSGLEQVKEIIVESLSTQWDPTNLPRAVETLHHIHGGLNMVPLVRAATVMETCGDYIEAHLVNSESKPGQELQTLAEAIASIDYYLERLAEGYGEDLDGYLDLAEDSMVQLGYEFTRPERKDEVELSSEDGPASEAQDFQTNDASDSLAEQDINTASADADNSPSAQTPDSQASTEGLAEFSGAETDDLTETREPRTQPFSPAFEPTLAQQNTDDGADDPEITQVRAAITDDMIAAATAEAEQTETDTGAEDSSLDLTVQEFDASEFSTTEPEPKTSAEETVDENVGAEEDDDDLIDDEIIEIFVEEAGEVQETLNEYFPQWSENLDDQEALTTVRRAFHTLKGSGRMVEALDVGELAWSIENMLNRIIDGTVTPDTAHLNIIRLVMEIIPDLVDAFKTRSPNPHPETHEKYMAWANALSKGETPDELTGDRVFSPEAASSEIDDQVADEVDDFEDEDQALWEIFASEANTHLAEVDAFLAEMDRSAPLYTPPTDSLQRALHTLKGSAHMAAVTPIASLITPLEGFVKELRSYQVKVDPDILHLIRDAADYTRGGLDCIERKETVEIPKLEQFVARVNELFDRHITPLVHLQEQTADGQNNVDPRLLAVIMAEEMSLLLDADTLLQQWRDGPQNDHGQMPDMLAELNAIAEAAQQANIPVMDELATCLANVYQGVLQHHIPRNEETYSALNTGHENLLDMVDQVAAGQDVQPAREATMVELQRLLDLAAALDAGEITDITGVSAEERALEQAEEDYADFPFEGEDDGFSSEEFAADLAAAGIVQAETDDIEEFVEQSSEHTDTQITDAATQTDNESNVDNDVDNSVDNNVDKNEESEFGETTELGEIELGEIEAGDDQPEEDLSAFVADSDDDSEMMSFDDEDSMAEALSELHNQEPVDLLSGDEADWSDAELSPEELSQEEPELDHSLTDDPLSVDAPDRDADTDDYLTANLSEPGEEPSAELNEEPSAEFNEEPLAGVNEEPSAEFNQEPSAEVEEPSAKLNEEPSAEAEEPSVELDEHAEFMGNAESILDDSELDLNEPLDEAALDASRQEPSDLTDDAIETEDSWDAFPSEEMLVDDLEDAQQSSEGEQSENLEVPEDESLDELELESLDQPLTESQAIAPPQKPRSTSVYDDMIDEPAATGEAAVMSLGEIAHIAEDDFDEDILEIFLEEANELMEELDEAIHGWESDQDNPEFPDTMKRALHTLKGGARLSGLMNLGELTHEFESFLIQTRSPNDVANFFPILLAYQDRIHNGVKAVRAQLDGEPLPQDSSASLAAALGREDELAKTPSKAESESDPTQAEAPDTAEPLSVGDAETRVEGSGNSAHEDSAAPKERVGDKEAVSTPPKEALNSPQVVVPFARKTVTTPSVSEDGEYMTVQPKAEAPQSPAQKRQGPQEMIKVSADLLEELVNLAGETSMSRGRLEQQISDLSGAVEEVEGTLSRLNEQLRRLDIETEAQVLFRQEQMAAHEGFDPLEMDRYSQLQQLTRSLMESASDLMDLKTTLNEKIKDTETLLLQQSRINSALQEGLMRSRMVPFSRLVPRLRRIVRQVAGELGKQVSFELDNVEGEMDRSVLERMVAPLEHMLRNAVDHGIEMPDVRVNDGKPEAGRILLSLAREGGDILLRLADDGRGINLDRVREKAIERGLMTAESTLTDHEVMQFILQAGFSTAESVTQISGRGVGMDVVAAEIKQLGGSIVIDSKAGVGSQFTVRLPFTVSVNRALMVQIANEAYAIPLNTIEGIVRVSPFELEHYYNHPEARFEYAGENYQVRHLGAMLNDTPTPKLDGQVLPMPVILVRSAQHAMALQVDGLMGSREIVVKSLGAQFAAVQGLSGATVMGDGSVVIILDPHALVRREVALASLPQTPTPAIEQAQEDEAPEEEQARIRTIMVVDDSVTVRKVTTRFLEREGFNVITAKDGVDALQVLQEDIPDLMLLDIEMPRMDGFEVAKNIRSTSRLKHLPIIMITSRTGDKHRQHALSIGVNEYLGKPYQEEQLLRTMEALLYKRKDNKQA